MLLGKDTIAMISSPDTDTDFFDFVARILERDTLALYLFIIYPDYIFRTAIDKMKKKIDLILLSAFLSY